MNWIKSIQFFMVTLVIVVGFSFSAFAQPNPDGGPGGPNPGGPQAGNQEGPNPQPNPHPNPHPNPQPGAAGEDSHPFLLDGPGKEGQPPHPPAPPKPPEKEKPKWFDILSIGGTLFMNYTYLAALNGNSVNANAFNIGRVYLDFKAKFPKLLSMRVTTDVFSSDALGAGSYRLQYLKYAFATVSPMKFLNFTFGLQGLPWSGGYLNGYDGLRILEIPFLIERHSMTGVTGALSSADVGFSVHSGTKKDSRVAEILDYWVGIFNGVFYKKWESDPYKDFAARIGAWPLDDDNMMLGIAINYHIHWKSGAAQLSDGASHYMAAAAVFSMKKFFYFHAEMFMHKYKAIEGAVDRSGVDQDSRGLSLVAKGFILEDLLDVFLRFDHYTYSSYTTPSDTSTGFSFKNSITGGVAIKIHPKYLWVLPNLQWESEAGPYVSDNSSVAINVDVQAKF